jgi:hypothetical protein
MSVVEDVRKGIQDVLAPDIKAIDARLTALDAAVKEGFASSERVAAARHELILAELRTAKTIADSPSRSDSQEFGYRQTPRKD